MRNRRGKGRPESRGHKLSYAVTCLLSAAEAEEKCWPYSPSLRAWLSSTLLRFENPVPPGSSLVSVIYVTPPPPLISRSFFLAFVSLEQLRLRRRRCVVVVVVSSDEIGTWLHRIAPPEIHRNAPCVSWLRPRVRVTTCLRGINLREVSRVHALSSDGLRLTALISSSGCPFF